MKVPCEIAVKSVGPSIRALLAVQLVETYGLTQRKTANLLGMTQTAISRYHSRERGRFREIERDGEVRGLILKLAASIVEEKLERTELMAQFCSVCRLVREKGFMCELCRRYDLSLSAEGCKCVFGNGPRP